MNTADKIGLLPGFGWLADLSFMGESPLGRFLSTLLVCWLVTPGLFILIGLVFEGRLVPLDSKRQFLSFWPGDLFLGIMATGLLRAARLLPEHAQPIGFGDLKFSYQSPTFHGVVLVAALAVAAFLTYGEWNSGAYPTAAILSPTKLYHNVVLYGLYGYVIIVTLVVVMADHSSWWFLAALIPGLIWVGLVIADNSSGKEQMAYKAAHAHVANWRPIFWVRH